MGTSVEESTAKQIAKKKWEAVVQARLQLRTELEYHSVALHYVEKNTKPEEWRGSGSGVLVKIRDRAFILTAGHCVRDKAQLKLLATLQSASHKFEVVGRSEYRYLPQTNQDFGFFEIPANQIGLVEAKEKVFLSQNRLVLWTATEARSVQDCFAILGYPKAGMVAETTQIVMSQALCYIGLPAGYGNAPASKFPGVIPGFESFDIALSRDGNRRYPYGAETAEMFTLPPFEGASGGGCWYLKDNGDLENWNPRQAVLVGIHVASHDQSVLPNAGCDFGTEVLIGHHLRLIAESYDDLKGYIFKTWPNVSLFAIQ